MKNLDRSVTEFYQKQQLEPAVLENILRESEQYRADSRESGLHLFHGIGRSIRHTHAKFWVPALAAAVLVIVVSPLVWHSFAGNEDGQLTRVERYPDNTNQSQANVNPLTGNVDSLQNLPTQNKLSDIVMREASLNHKSKLQLDFETNDFQKLSQSMEQLDFELELPARLLPVSVAREGEFVHEPNDLSMSATSLSQASRSKRLQLAGARYCTVAGHLAAHVKLQDNSNTDVSLFVTPTSSDFESVTNQSAQYSDGVQVSSWNENGLFYLLVTQP